MDEWDEWSIVDKASLDPEVNMQIEFVSWLNKHPDASRDGEPVLSFGEGLQIYLCGHCWHLRTTSKSVTVVGRTGGWNGQLPSFSVHRVEPIDGGRISSGHHVEEEIRPVCGLPFQNPLGFPKICQEDPLDRLEQQSADPELRSEIRCKFFICLETIGAADSFDEVLDAMYEFGAWYAVSLREMQSAQIFEYDPFREKELELWNRIRYLKDQAEDASLMCRTALEAQEAVSKAAATMLENCFPLLTIGMRFWEEESGNQAALSWAEGFKRSQAVREGFVLQWCRVDKELGGRRSSWIDCELDVGELLVEEAEAEAAEWVGIVKDKPLSIRIDAVTKSVKISQEQFEGRKNVGTDFLLPQVVQKHVMQLWDQPHETLNNNNVLVAMLHEVASYLSNLSSICLVCSESLHGSIATDDRFPRLCAQTLCEANFDCWTSASWM